MNDLLEAALQYAELGYPVFPCAPGRKTPITKNGFKDATTDAGQIERWWQQFPNANIAIATEGLLVVDVDSKENPWLSEDSEKSAELARGPLSRTANGGRQYIYRQPAGRRWRSTNAKLAPKVDTRANGGYIVVPPSVLAGERRYQWAPGMELDEPPARLPEPPAWLVAELDRLASSSPMSPRVAALAAGANQIPSGQRNSTLASLAGAMRRVGMAEAEILAALLRANADRCVPPLSPAEVQCIAASVARYEPDQVATALAENHWAQLWEKEAPPPGPADPGPFPEHLLTVPGFVADVMAYNLATAIRPQPVLALASAICLQAVLAARKVCDERGNRTNVYVIGIADSGRGKDHGRKVNRNILFHAGLDYLEGNEDIASDAGLVAAVEQQPGVLFQVDEFGRFLRTIGDPKKAPHLFNVIGTLMKLYSSADTVFRGKAYADPKRSRVIDQPCVSLYGTTVPEHFFESLTAEGLTDGFVARLMAFEAHNVTPRQRVPFTPPPAPIIEAARWWGELRNGGDLREEHPKPIVVTAADTAQGVFDDLAEIVDIELTSGTFNARSLWARVEEKACRLALIYACSANREQLEIDQPAAQWACELSTYLTRRMLMLANQWIADGSFDALQKKVLRIVRQAGGRIGRNELCRRTQSFSVRLREDILQNLLATGQIEEQSESNGPGRPKTWYVVR
jgi:hypothetical protein